MVKNHYALVEESTEDHLNQRFNVTILDARYLYDIDRSTTEKIETLREMHPESTLLFLSDIDISYTLRTHLKRYGIVCSVGDNPDLLLARLQKLMDNLVLADECGERLKTLACLRKNSLSKPFTDTGDGPLKVLVTGSPCPLFLRVMKSLEDSGCRTTAAISAPMAVTYLEQNDFDSLVLLPHDKPKVYSSLVKLVRRNYKTKHLPVLVFAHEASLPLPETASSFLNNGADLVLREDETESALYPEVRSFSRRSKLTRNMRQFLEKSAPHSDEKLERVADAGFFETHFDRQCESSRKFGKQLSLSTVKISSESGRSIPEDVWEQILSYTGMMLDETDLLTIVGRDTLLVSHAGKALIDAHKVQKRISYVLQEIRFDGIHGTGDAAQLKILGSTVVLRPEETAKNLIKRAMGSLKPTRRPVQKKPSAATLTLVH